MSAKYIIRLDDACSESDLSKWNAIEKILDEHNISPIVAVVPENKDPMLMYQQANPGFWDMVKRWEEKSWSIAMHGYQHVFHDVERKKLVFPFYDRSEFGGLSLEEQRQKLRKSLKIFRENNIEPSLWVAPAHSFDDITLGALAKEVPFNIVSDGIAYTPYRYKNFYFVPQQLWKIKKKSFGIWTVCLHPDTMSAKDIESFKSDLSLNHVVNNLIKLTDIDFSNKGKGILSGIYSWYFWARYRVASFVKKQRS